MRLIRFFFCLSSFILTLLDSAQLISDDNLTFLLCFLLLSIVVLVSLHWFVFFSKDVCSREAIQKRFGFFNAESIYSIHDLSNATIAWSEMFNGF